MGPLSTAMTEKLFCASCHVQPPGEAPRSTARMPGAMRLPELSSPRKTMSASASFTLEREGDAPGMRRRTIPMGLGELLSTRVTPTWHALPPTKKKCRRSAALASSKTTPALASAFSRCGANGLVSAAELFDEAEKQYQILLRSAP